MFFTLRPKLVLGLMVQSYGLGWGHLRPDLVALRMVQAALIAIERGDQGPAPGVRFRD
jgi:hypothetical protein